MKIVSKEDFIKVWEDTSREQILNQFYYDYKTLREEYEKWNELKKWLEDENNQKYSQYIYNYSINNWVLDKMQELEGKSE